MEPGQMVWCVVCVDEGTDPDIVHIFSSAEKAAEFCEADTHRSHVTYDYMIDNPARMEAVTQ